MVKPCAPPFSIDDSKSPFFSAQEFLDLLQPHLPKLIGPDVFLKPIDRGFIPFVLINPTPYGQDLVQHQFGFRFLPSFTNAIYALVTRVLAVPSVTFPKKFVDKIHWYVSPQMPRIFENWVVNEYIAHLKPHQKARILRAMDGLEDSYEFSNSTAAFAKSDELLFKLKARIIWNVPPGFQAALGPLVRQMTLFLKEHVANGTTIHSSSSHCKGYVPTDHYTLAFACGMTSVELDQWYNHSLRLLQARTIDWAGIFMGDDTFILEFDRESGSIISKECDYSSYDSTQRDAAQLKLRQIYENWGVPPPFLRLFQKMAEAPLKVQYGPERQYAFKIKLPTPQTATGKPDTCLGNTILNIHATVHHQVLSIPFEKFGFVAKMKQHSVHSYGTFLKGAWLLGLDGLYHWQPLPGACMKLLKSFAPVPSLETGLKMNLSSIGPVSTPLTRVLLERFPPDFVKQDTDYKIFTQVHHDLDQQSLNKFLEYRYGADSVDLFRELEDALRIVKLGEVLFHPLWKILADVDYGDGRSDSGEDNSSLP